MDQRRANDNRGIGNYLQREFRLGDFTVRHSQSVFNFGFFSLNIYTGRRSSEGQRGLSRGHRDNAASSTIIKQKKNHVIRKKMCLNTATPTLLTCRLLSPSALQVERRQVDADCHMAVYKAIYAHHHCNNSTTITIQDNVRFAISCKQGLIGYRSTLFNLIV